MNTQPHRLVFNKSRGCLMAVAESARSAGGGCSGARRSSGRPANYGSTTETANNTVINGQLNIGAGINTTVQIPEGKLKTRLQR